METIYWSPASRGFYSSVIHGARQVEQVVCGESGDIISRKLVLNPECAIPADAVEVSGELRAELLRAEAFGKVIATGSDGLPFAADPPAPTAEQVKAQLSMVVQRHLDRAARAMGYDDIRSAVSYADEPAVAKFQAEGQALRAWRSRVWAACEQVLAKVQSGERAIPSAADLVAELPLLQVPSE